MIDSPSGGHLVVFTVSDPWEFQDTHGTPLLPGVLVPDGTLRAGPQWQALGPRCVLLAEPIPWKGEKAEWLIVTARHEGHPILDPPEGDTPCNALPARLQDGYVVPVAPRVGGLIGSIRLKQS